MGGRDGNGGDLVGEGSGEKGEPKINPLQRLAEELRGMGSLPNDATPGASDPVRAALTRALDQGRAMEASEVRSAAPLEEGVNVRRVEAADLSRISSVFPESEQIERLGRKVQPGDWMASLSKPLDSLLDGGKAAPTLRFFSPEDAARQLVPVPGRPGELLLVRPSVVFVSDVPIEQVTRAGVRIIHPAGTVVSLPLDRIGRPEFQLSNYDSPAQFKDMVDNQHMIVDQDKARPVFDAISREAAYAEVNVRERLLTRIEERNAAEQAEKAPPRPKAEFIAWLREKATAQGADPFQYALLNVRNPEEIKMAMSYHLEQNPQRDPLGYLDSINQFVDKLIGHKPVHKHWSAAIADLKTEQAGQPAPSEDVIAKYEMAKVKMMARQAVPVSQGDWYNDGREKPVYWPKPGARLDKIATDLQMAAGRAKESVRAIYYGEQVQIEQFDPKPIIESKLKAAEERGRQRMEAEAKAMEPARELERARKALIAEVAEFSLGTLGEPSSSELPQWLQDKAKATGLSPVEVAALGLKSQERIAEAFELEAKNNPAAIERLRQMMSMMPESMSTRAAWIQVLGNQSGDSLLNTGAERVSGGIADGPVRAAAADATGLQKHGGPLAGKAEATERPFLDRWRRIWKGGGGRAQGIAALTTLGLGQLYLDEQ